MEVQKMYMLDDGIRTVPVYSIRPLVEGGVTSEKYVQACVATGDGGSERLTIMARKYELREATDEEVKLHGWKIPNETKGKGVTEQREIRSDDSVRYVATGTGKVERGYRFNSIQGSWKYSDVTGDMLKELLRHYGLKQKDVARKCGFTDKNFRERYLVSGKKITIGTYERIEKTLSEMLGRSRIAIKSDLRAISGKGV